MATQPHLDTHSPRPTSRRRLVIFLLLLLIFALGFVYFPARPAPGAWQRALTAARQAQSAHLIGTVQTPEGALLPGLIDGALFLNGNLRFDKWLTSDGFCRTELWRSNALACLALFQPTGDYLYFDPRLHAADDSDFPLLHYILPGFTQRTKLTELAPEPSHLYNVKLTERRQFSLWRGTREVVELQGDISTDARLGRYSEADSVRLYAEIDPKTSLINYLSEDWFVNRWQPHYRTSSISWNSVPPTNLRTFLPPKGTSTYRVRWWNSRVNKIIATAKAKDSDKTRDLKFTLHAIDANRYGDLFLTLSPANLDGSVYAYASGLQLIAEGVDDTGTKYYGDCEQLPWSKYFIVNAQRDRLSAKPGVPHSVTLNVTSKLFKGGNSKREQTALFTQLNLPPRQKATILIRMPPLP